MADRLPEPDFARVFDEAPVPLLLLTPDFVIVRANRARLEGTAKTNEETIGRGLFDVFPMNPDDPAADGLRNLSASLARVRDTGRPHNMAIQRYDIPMPDGTYVERFWSPRNVPIFDDEGRVVLLLHRSDDVTDYIRDRDEAQLEAARGQKWRHRVEQVESDLFSRARELETLNAELLRANERERRVAQQLAGLAATASGLAAAETTEDLLSRLFHHGRMATGADAAVVALCRDEVLQLSVADAAGRSVQLPTTLRADASVPVAVAARGQRLLLRDGSPTSPLGPMPAPYGDLSDQRVWAALPLRAGGQLLGSLTLGWSRAHDLDDDAVRLLEAFAAQCAQAVDRVVRLEAERGRASATRTLAESLQRSLLTEPPEPEHLQIAVRYLAATEEVQVGGDWYDAFLTPDGVTTLVIGDVTGHDSTSAAVMGQLRNLLRGIAHALDRSPAETLRALDRALRDLRMSTLATAVLARVELVEGDGAPDHRVLHWSNAGHPPPVLVEPDGTARVLERPADLLLGLIPDMHRGDHVVPLEPGATVVLYTDGLVERRDEALDDSLERLAAAASELADLPLEDFCDGLLTRLDPADEDDIALVALRALPYPAREEWVVAADEDLPADTSAAHRARESLTAALDAPGIDVDTAELLVSELVTNAVRHGGGRVGMRVLTRPGLLRVEVHDELGAVAPTVRSVDAESEGGRGMWLIDAMATRWGTVQHDGDGKEVWFELA